MTYIMPAQAGAQFGDRLTDLAGLFPRLAKSLFHGPARPNSPQWSVS
jgi:hypothetical protein